MCLYVVSWLIRATPHPSTDSILQCSATPAPLPLKGSASCQAFIIFGTLRREQHRDRCHESSSPISFGTTRLVRRDRSPTLCESSCRVAPSDSRFPPAFGQRERWAGALKPSGGHLMARGLPPSCPGYGISFRQGRIAKCPLHKAFC